MPAKSPPNTKAPPLAPVEPNLRSQDSELTAAGRELAEDLGTSDTDRFSSPAERRAAERTERRRQRTEVQGEAAGGRQRSTRSGGNTP